MKMIELLNTTNLLVCRQILRLQRKSYQVEVDMIGYDIPPMRETPEDIPKIADSYYGYFENSRLVGIIAVAEADKAFDICKLFIDPSYFRKGIGKGLMVFAQNLAKKRGNQRLTVSTAADNAPAVALYLKFGFRIMKYEEKTDGPKLVHFEKNIIY